MSNVLLFIEGVDRSEYFKPPLRVSPAGDGVVGSTTINLSQQAGGLDIRPMEDVRIWVPHNTTTNAGIVAKGRLFGGLVSKRQTKNIGTTKLWSLPCYDYNIILKKSYRRAAAVYAVPLVSGTFADQMKDLFVVLQGATPITFIDADTHVADLYPTMPAVTYPGGHRWFWYVEELLKTVHLLDPAIFPSYYMGVSTGFGASETFGLPTLHVYDAASPPASSVSFSDTPTGSEKDVFEYLVRDTDATAMSQLQQSWWSGLVVTATDATSISTYPNPYDDHTGAWVDGDVLEDTTSTTIDEAQALVDNIIFAKGAPRDSFKWVTYERLVPGEYVDLKWDLEGIPPGTQYRVAAATFEWEEPNVIKSTLTINTRRLGLFEDGGGFFARPIEGDNVPPLPAADFTLTSNVYNFATGLADLTFAIDNTGASPDTAGYRIIGVVNGLPDNWDVGMNLTPTLTLAAGVAFALRVVAYDNTGNYSETFPAPANPALTGTTQGAPFHFDVPNPSFELGFSDELYYWLNFDEFNGVSRRVDTHFASGRWSMELEVPGSGDVARRRSEIFLAAASDNNAYTLDFWAEADATLDLGYTVVSYTYDGTSFTPVNADSGVVSIGTTARRYAIPIVPAVAGGFVTIQFTNDTDATIAHVDDVKFRPQTITEGMVIPAAFNLPTDVPDGFSIFHPEHGVIVTYLLTPDIWVGPEVSVGFSWRGAMNPPFTADDYLYRWEIESGRTYWVDRLVLAIFPISPNDGSNYWEAGISKGSDGTYIESEDTSADAPSDWRQHPIATFTGNPFDNTIKAFEVKLVKHGSPGGSYISAKLVVREVWG